MAEYIDRKALIEHLEKDPLYDLVEQYGVTGVIESFPAADVQPVKHGKNIATDYDEVDQFMCSECGIELQNWVRVERDEDDGDETRYEYRFNFCPNCGALMGDEDDV